MQFTLKHASVVRGLVSSRDYLVHATMFRDVNRELLPSIYLSPLLPDHPSNEVYIRKIGCITTSGTVNRFRDHDCDHLQFDGSLEAYAYDVSGVDTSSTHYASYYRGRSSFLQTNLDRVGTYAFIADIGKVYFLNYAYPRNWDNPDGSCMVTNPQGYTLQVFKTTECDGFHVHIVHTGSFYFRRNYITQYAVCVYVTYSDKQHGESYTATRLILSKENEDGWDLYPNTSGFEQEWLDMQSGIMPECSLLSFKIQEIVNDLKETGEPLRHEYKCIQKSIDIPDSDVLYKSLCEFTNPRMSKIKYPDIQEFWQTEQSAIQDCKTISVNGLEFLKDIPVFGREIPQLIQTTKKLRSRRRVFKAIADQYLALRYGTQLTIADAKEITKSMSRNNRAWMHDDFSRVYGRSMSEGTDLPKSVSSSTLLRSSKIYYCPKDRRLNSVIKGLTDVGLYPTSENVWDLIPFSFVIDWFTSIGEICEMTDNDFYAVAYLDILSVLSSDKKITTFCTHPLSDRFNGDIDRVDYSRKSSRVLHQPKLDLRLQTSYLNHVIELSAIAVSRR